MIKLDKEQKGPLYFSILTALRQTKALETRLQDAMYYVDPKSNLTNIFSLCAREIIVGSCLAIESVAVEFARSIGQPFGEALFGKEFGKFIVTNDWDKDLQEFTVSFRPLLEYSWSNLTPWKHEDKQMPDWWCKGYNTIKHNGNYDISNCTYDIAISALAGFYSFIGFIVALTELTDLKLSKPLLNQEYLPKTFYCAELSLFL